MVILLTVSVTLIILPVLFFPSPAAGSDALKRELLAELLAADTADSAGVFGTYEELYLAKTQTQAVLQGMEGEEVTQITKEWVDLLLGIITDFEELADLSNSADPSDHRTALELAERINSSISMLDRYDSAKDNGIPMLAALALERFYRGEGEFFEALSRIEEETRVKIEYEQLSSSSYRKGGVYTISDASRMEFESRRDEYIYNRDMERASDYLTASRSHLASAQSPSSGFFGAAFIEILKARDSFEQAQTLYEKHHDKALNNLGGLDAEIGGVYQRLILETLKGVALYLLILSFFTVFLWRDFERWNGDMHDTRLGEALID
jgi:transcriptional regulator with XRE-family HTH domain